MTLKNTNTSKPENNTLSKKNMQSVLIRAQNSYII
jgi:hypothetical protein